ncbi:hypothetical protein J31TS4_09240 [Paenibacillus sp. J31TS4]|uniref:IucA/IucC family C-terminal-domain containing protein n=1 Tax=Paenibacillus sp. J31TS4 TaxID=2807195 RepID=UPI001B133443|nr:IucA/IucC family C-terminal-domain containing protein [Paenibacillus sp. J31TS4]GIP37644.1 hypothetical protein J31TS4_09240 [Paenibacillus sp. J31TS4]
MASANSVREYLASSLLLVLEEPASPAGGTESVGEGADDQAAAGRSDRRTADFVRFEGASLLDRQVVNRLLDTVGRSLGTDKRAVAASLFFKHYCRALSGAFYAWIQAGVALDLSLAGLELRWHEACRLEVVVRQPQGWLLSGTAAAGCSLPEESADAADSSPAAHPGIESTGPRVGDAGRALLPDRSLLPIPSPGGSEASEPSSLDVRETFARRLYAEHLGPLIGLLSEVTRLKKAILWENALIYLLAAFNTLETQASTAEECACVREERRFWTEQAPASWFGTEETVNPLCRPGCLVPHPLGEEDPIRVRERCCLKVLLPGGTNCTSCCRIDEDERRRLFEKKKGV